MQAKELYLDTLSITQLKSLLPSVYHWVIEARIAELKAKE